MRKPVAERLQKCVFTSTASGSRTHRCVFVFHKQFAVTYKHGGHSTLQVGECSKIYGVEDESCVIEVVVRVVSQLHDFIIFEISAGEFPVVPSHQNMWGEIYSGQHYDQLSIDTDRGLNWKSGTIMRLKKNSFYYIGDSRGKNGDSGAPIFDDFSGKFIGMSVAKKDFRFEHLQNSLASIDFAEVAEHHPDCLIIPAILICGSVDLKEENDDDPFVPTEEKKRRLD